MELQSASTDHDEPKSWEMFAGIQEMGAANLVLRQLILHWDSPRSLQVSPPL